MPGTPPAVLPIERERGQREQPAEHDRAHRSGARLVRRRFEVGAELGGAEVIARAFPDAGSTTAGLAASSPPSSVRLAGGTEVLVVPLAARLAFRAASSATLPALLGGEH